MTSHPGWKERERAAGGLQMVVVVIGEINSNDFLADPVLPITGQ